MVKQIIDVSHINAECQGGQYGNFLGLQNTEVGQWFNKTVLDIPTKNKYDKARADANIADFQRHLPPNPNVDTVPLLNPTDGSGGGGSSTIPVTEPDYTAENNKIIKDSFGNVVSQPGDMGTQGGSLGKLYSLSDQLAASMGLGKSPGISKHNNTWIWLLVFGAAIGGGYYYYKKHHHKS